MRFDARWLPVGFVVAVAIAAVMSGGKSSARERLSSHIGLSGVDRRPDLRADLAELAKPFVRSTRFESRVRVQEAPRDGYLNLYVLPHPAIERDFGEVTCNCGYLGQDLIVCDEAFLDTFSSMLHFDRAQTNSIPVLNKVNSLFATVLLKWIVGHEVAHALLHSGPTAASITWTLLMPEGQRTEARRREAEADAYVAARLPLDEWRPAYFALANVVFQVYSQAYLHRHGRFGVGQEGSELVFVEQPRDGIHPPWVLRAAQVAGALAHRTAEADADMLDDIVAKFRFGPEGYSMGDTCSGQNLRSLVPR